MASAIQNKIKELKMAPKSIVRTPQKPKPKGWERVKNWAKERFFKKRGRK